MFKIEFKTANDAFHASGPDAMAEEIARILRAVADSVEAGNESGIIRDYNGNNVGWWSLP